MLAEQAITENHASHQFNNEITLKMISHPYGCGWIERDDPPPGLLGVIWTIDQFFKYNLLYTAQLRKLSSTQISVLKSRMNKKVEMANKKGYAIQVRGLNKLIKDYSTHSKCNHLMQSCIRYQDPIMEVLTHLKAAVTSTKINQRSLPLFQFQLV